MIVENTNRCLNISLCDFFIFSLSLSLSLPKLFVFASTRQTSKLRRAFRRPSRLCTQDEFFTQRLTKSWSSSRYHYPLFNVSFVIPRVFFVLLSTTISLHPILQLLLYFSTSYSKRRYTLYFLDNNPRLTESWRIFASNGLQRS